MIPKEDAEKLSDRLAEATLRVAADYADEDVIDEESFTGQLCGRLKETIHAFETETLVWQVQTSTSEKGIGRLKARSLGKVREEPMYGADLVMVIEASNDHYEVRKGFLAQAKRLEVGKRLSAKEYGDLRAQCHQMLLTSASSYVFFYSKTGVHVVSANAVLADRTQDIWSLPTWTIEILFYDFAICWLGDYRLQTTERRSLEELRATLDANGAIRILGKPKFKESAPVRRRKVKI
jgi:hypothetical protein